MRKLKRSLALLLTLVMLITALPVQVFAYLAPQDGPITIVDQDGNTVTTDESWETTFPNGTFAFGDFQAVATEGGQTTVIEVMRLGGTAGRAIAYVSYEPAVSKMPDGTATYSTAAGSNDIIIEAEDPLPGSEYQPVGQPEAPLTPVTPVAVKRTDTEDGAALSVDVEADSYQWYVYYAAGWEIVSGATEATFVTSAEDLAEYDFRCVFTVDGTEYSSDSYMGYSPDEFASSTAAVPDGEAAPVVDLNAEPTFTRINPSNDEDPYLGYVFDLTFAEGEWVKEIRITVPEDSEAETLKFGTFTIVAQEGASLYDTANTLSLRVEDNDEAEASTLGFAVSDIQVDKATGTAELTVTRTGGNQTMVTIDYATEDGTAIAGEDYAAASGTLTFYGDLTEQTIRISLIDDGEATDEAVDFRVVLSNLKGDGETPCTLETAEAVVSLYNSGEGEGENLATYLHETEVADVSASVSEADAVVPVDDGETVAVQTEEETETHVARYVSPETGEVSPLSYGYPNLLDFGHVSTWWTYADELPSSGWDGGGSNSDYIRYVHSKGASSASLPLDPRLYEGVYAKMGWKCALGSAGTLFWYGTEYTYPWVRLLREDSSEFAREDSGHYHTSQNITTKLYYYGSGSMSKMWSIADNVKTLQIGTSRYDAHNADSDAEANLKNGSMVYRRYFKGDFYLTVHTANDENTATGSSAVLTEESGVYDSMRPEISISGGGAHYGDLFVGTTLKIDLKNTASYVPATADNNLSYAVYLTNNKTGQVVPAEVSNSGNTYYLKLLWNGMTDTDVNSTDYTINVVMTRKQNLKIDISPSVPRLTDADGMPTGSIDQSKVDDAINAFWNSTKPYMSYGRSVENTSGSTITYTQTENSASWTGYEQDGAMLTFEDIENLQWINFNLPAEDKIVFNGRTYDGNAKIYLTVEDLARANMTFYYYDSAYLSSVSTMVASISDVELFLDANGNGMIDGYYNKETGYFIPEEGDVSLGFLDPDLSYNELYFQPVKLDNGKYAQYFMKVYYNMNARSLIPEAGTDTTAKAQVLPAFISTITEGDSYELLTEEQKAYRYIISGKTKLSEDAEAVRSSDNHVMYGSEAAAVSMVDVPLGGDISPAKLNEARTAYTWTPNYQGNLLYPFKNPEPITIAESLAGTNIPIAAITGVDGSGNVILEDGGADKLNGYLGSLTANNTVALCVQEQTMTTEEIAEANKVDIGGGGVALQAGGETGESLNVESVNTTDNKVTPDARHLQEMSSGDDPATAEMDMSESSFDYPEFNQEFGIDLPETEIGLTDFGSIVMDGDQVGFTFGLPLGGFNSSGDAGAAGTGGSGDDHRTGAGDAIKSSGETIANIVKWLRHPRSMAKEVDDSYQSVTDERDSSNSSLRTGKKVSSKEFAAEFSLSAAFMFKYDPIANEYKFSQFAMAVSAELGFSYQARFTPCPILYIYVTVHFDVEFSFGADVERETVALEKNLVPDLTSTDSSDNRQYNDLKKSEFVVVNNHDKIQNPILGQNEVEYNFKALNLNFNGTVLLEAFTDEDCTQPLEDFQGGYLSSTGSDDVLVILGQEVSQNDPIYLKITALQDTKLYSGNLVLMTTNKTTFGAFSISPELYLQVGAGVGIEILKAEIYAKISVGCLMAFGNYNEDVKNDYEVFRLREFDFGMALGVSVQALFFSYDLDLIGLNVAYNWEGNPQWTYTWSALNGAYGGDLKSQSEGEEDYGVHVRLPGSSAGTQDIYSAETFGSDLDTLAYNPKDVPFQLSGYSSSGDAFKLADGLASGYEYQVVTVGDQNYLLYTVSRSDAAHPVDNSMLVLSRLQLTDTGSGDSYGLVNPIDPGSATKYIIVDDDGTGDLEFTGWADGDTLRIAWVSYATARDAEPAVLTQPTSTCPEDMTQENYATVFGEMTAPDEVTEPTAPTVVEKPKEDKPTAAPVESEYYVKAADYTAEKYPDYKPDPADNPTYYYAPAYDSLSAAQAAYQTKKTLWDAWEAYEKYVADQEQYDEDLAAYNDYVEAKAEYDLYKEWYDYFLSVDNNNAYNQRVADEAAKNTVVKTASFNTASPAAISDAATVNTAGSHVYLPGGSTDGTVTIYAQAEHYTDTTDQEKAYEAYLNAKYSDAEMGSADAAASIRAYRAAYQKGLWDAYGQGTELYAAVGSTAVAATVPDGGIVDNMEITEIGGTYYVAYTTSKQAYVDDSGRIIQDGTNAKDMITTKRLYLQTVTVQEGKAVWGTAKLLRTLVDYDQDSSKDGVYSNSTLSSTYQDPYFANLQFLNGKLGSSLTGGEAITLSDTAEEFLLFEMNGSTYVIPENDLESITASNSGTIYPFFQPEEQMGDAGGDSTATPSSTGRSEVTIGADGAGNISAVYVASVEGTTNNALYLTKWDPVSSTWGTGTMLAMNYMQVYEDSLANGWSAADTEQAYLGKLDGYNDGGMDQFVFSDLQIALGQTDVTGSDASTQSEDAEVMISADLDRIQEILGGDVQTLSAGEMTDEQARALAESLTSEQLSLLAEKSNEGSRDTLLVLTRGVTTELMDYTQGEQTYIVPKEQTGTTNGTGIYAISYGVGQQEVGNATAEFAEYDFTAGSELFITGSFQNIGDVGLRGSEANPITVKLMLNTGTGEPTELATWEIKENIPAGKVVNLSGTCKALSQDLPKGSTFSFLVSEDETYSTGAFSGETNKFLTVEDKPELRFESFSISSSSVDANGNTILDVEFQVGNRGTKTAEDVYAQFRYESGRDDENNAVYTPLDISTNTLSVSKQEDLETLAGTNDYANGILYLNNAEDGGSIDPNKGRTVTGTITVPPSVYQGAENGSLNLQVEIFSAADTITRETNGIITADHGEYNGVNNVRNTSVEHATYFDTADQVTLAIGTTLRLPVSIATSTGEDPVIQVLEVPDTQNGEKNLGVLYYQKSTSTGTGNTQGYIVISPSKEGTGVLEIKDQATNTIHPVAYKVTSMGEGINIFKDNEFFTFYNSNKSEYDPSAAAGSQDWTFDDKANLWGSGEKAEAPYRFDLAKGKTGAYFTFDTVAESIDFHFNGKIQVSSTYPGFRAVELTSTGGKDNYASVSFGSQGETHTVTVKVLASDDGYPTTDFDVIVEHYPDGEPPVPSADATSPHLYWSRSFPETASVETGESVTVTLYVLDDTGLSRLTVDGEEPANIRRTDDGFWSVELTISENGQLSVEALDNSGNRTTQTVQVDWFNSTVASGAISTAPDVDAKFYKNDTLMSSNDYIKQGDKATVKASSNTQDVTFSAQRLTVNETEEGASELRITDLPHLEDTSDTFDAKANGFYVVKATASNGTWSQIVLQMTQVDDNLPSPGLTYVEADQVLRWSVTKANPKLSPITEAKINGYDVLDGQSSTIVGGTLPIEYGGTYTLAGKDQAGHTFSVDRTVELPIYALEGEDPATVTNVTDYDTENGVITVHPDVLRGGTYVTAKSTPAENKYAASYEWRLVEKEADSSGGSGDASTLAQLLADDEQWVTTEELTGLAPGDYTLYIRDANDKDNEETVLRVQLTLDRTVGDERITLSFEERTDEDGSRYLDWSAEKGSDPLQPITSVTINGQPVITGSGTAFSGTWDLAFAGKYVLAASDSGTPSVTISNLITVKDVPVTVSAPGKLAVVQHPWNQAGDNGTVTLNLVDGTTQLVTGGLYDTATSNTAAGVYVGQYEWLLTAPFTFDREAALEALKKAWLEEHPDQTTIPEEELAKLEAQADQQETEAQNKWLADLLADDNLWTDFTTTAADNSVTGLKAGDYALLIRDAQDPDNIKTVYQQELTLNNQRITLTATPSSASGGQNNGSVTARAEGGYLDRSTYQFAIRPITGEDDTVTIDQMTSALDREKFPEEVYAAPKWDIPDFTVLTDPDEINETSYTVLKTAVLDGLAPGWYQVAVRPMLNVTTDDLVSLAKLAAAYTAADLKHQEAADNATASGITRQVNQKTRELQEALTAWRNAEDADKDAALEAYKNLINSDPDILAALTVWEAAGFRTGEAKNAYDTAVKDYFTTQVTTESEQAEAAAETALADAKSAYETEYKKLMGVVDAAYRGTDADIGWGNGTTITVYVSRATSSDQINVSDLRYPDDETVEVHFTRTKIKLSTAAEKRLIEDNETRNIKAYSDTMMAVIPAGTLQKGDDVMAMLMPTVKIPEDTLGTVVERTTPDGETSYVPWSVVSLGKVWYIADQPGEYRLVTNLVSFTDVPETFWGYKAITFTAARELFEGVGNDLFKPDGTMTRSMLVTVLGRLAGIDPADYAGKSDFTDVDADSWYGPYVAWAAENGVVEGIGNGKFAPDDPITREQLCTMLVRYLGISDLNMPNVEDPATFSDQTQISDWAAEAVECFRLSGIVEGFAGAFRPQWNATRAEVSTVLARLITSILTNM